MREITKCLGENVKSSRKKLGLTQAELANKAGISLIFLQGIEAGRKWISPTTTKTLARALHLTESQLFENCFDQKTSPTGSKTKKLNTQKKAVSLDHIPDDILRALATTCKHSAWNWEAFRWLIKGFQHHRKTSSKFS